MQVSNNREIIGAYSDVCQALSQEEFCSRCRHAFLLHSTASGAMIPTDQTRGLTVDRLVLADDSTERGRGPGGKAAAYSVFALEPSDSATARVSVGCSSSCDVQINDESVSSLHATFQFDGNRYLIQDQDSAAGTMVNDEVLSPGKAVPVSSGDRISLGYVDLTFLDPVAFYRFVKLFFGL